MGTYLYRRENGVWYILVKNKGEKPKHISTKERNKAAAHEVFKRYKESGSTTRIVTLQELEGIVAERLAVHLRQSTLNGYVAILRQLRSIIGDKPLADITVDDIERYKIERLKRIKPITLHIELRALKAVFGRCVKWQYITTSVLQQVELPTIKKTVQPYLTEQQFVELLKVVDNQLLRDVFTFAFFTGLRLGEIRHLKYGDVNLKENILYIRDSGDHLTKTEESERTVPIPQLLLPVVQRYMARQHGQYLFGIRRGVQLQTSYLSHNFKRVIRLAKMDERLHFHSLRHSYATLMISKGVDLYIIAQLLGHSDTTMLQRIYAHVNNDMKQQAVAKLSDEEKKKLAVKTIDQDVIAQYITVTPVK